MVAFDTQEEHIWRSKPKPSYIRPLLTKRVSDGGVLRLELIELVAELAGLALPIKSEHKRKMLDLIPKEWKESIDDL